MISFGLCTSMFPDRQKADPLLLEGYVWLATSSHQRKIIWTSNILEDVNLPPTLKGVVWFHDASSIHPTQIKSSATSAYSQLLIFLKFDLTGFCAFFFFWKKKQFFFVTRILRLHNIYAFSFWSSRPFIIPACWREAAARCQQKRWSVAETTSWRWPISALP